MNKLRIGIDCLTMKSNSSGISRYTHEMIEGLSKFQCIILIYYCNKNSVKDFSNNQNIILRRCRFRNKILRNLWFLLILPIFISRDNVDIFWGPSHKIPFFLNPKVKKIVTIHDMVWAKVGFTMNKINYLMEKIFMPYALINSDLILTDSHSTKNDITEMFPKLENKIKIVYPRIKIFNKSEEIPANISKLIKTKYFLFVGTLEPRKNLIRLVNAYISVLNEIKTDLNLFIIGMEGWGKDKIRDTIQKSLYPDKIVQLGYVTDNLLAHFYSNAEFIILPSLYEGFGFPIIEAQSFGTPVITSDNSSMKEIMGDGGILIDPLSEDSIKKGIINFLNIENVKYFSKKAKNNANRFFLKDSAKTVWREIKLLHKSK